jgi:hypothetical protein
VDFVEGFPRIGGKSVVLTVVNCFSKYNHFLPLGHPYTAVSLTKVFFDNIVKLHGIPCSIVNDRDPVFTNTFWTELFRLSGVQLPMNAAFPANRQSVRGDQQNPGRLSFLPCGRSTMQLAMLVVVG